MRRILREGGLIDGGEEGGGGLIKTGSEINFFIQAPSGD